LADKAVTEKMAAKEKIVRPGNLVRVVNDFCIVVSTANGTGSQTANLALLRAFFDMGIPVNGKNIFPSNIAGLPTWYHIRVNQEGFVGRKEPSILIAFNRATFLEDVAELHPGGVCFYNQDFGLVPDREDITCYPIPVKEMTADSALKGKLREYVANMTFLGVIAQSIGISVQNIESALLHQFGGRQKLVDPNIEVVRVAFEWSKINSVKSDPFYVSPLGQTEGKVLMTGNEAGALGAVFGGVSVAGWYPITPSTSFIDALRKFLPEMRNDGEGKATYHVVQAEDEIAGLGIAIGAGWAGARSLTATSGPGISLMSEFVGFGYFAEIPVVIWDIQRVGPSTGLPTRTSQGDLASTYQLGHGDSKHVVLLPSSIEECFQFGYQAHELAEKLQTPVFVLSDLDLGMNSWMGDPFPYPNEPIKRGKVLSPEALGGGPFERYKDVDGDGIGYRTLPGNTNPISAYFTRGTGHDTKAEYSERGEDWQENFKRLSRKFETARRLVPGATKDVMQGSSLCIVAFGSTQYAIEEARHELSRKGFPTDFIRMRALPVNHSDLSLFKEHEKVIVIEMNNEGQLCGILRNEMPEVADRFISVAHLDGMPLTSEWVERRLGKHLEGWS
jgi:2-oxoglutarate ferredoxin oxidoreductase subunit alpha